MNYAFSLAIAPPCRAEIVVLTGNIMWKCVTFLCWILPKSTKPDTAGKIAFRAVIVFIFALVLSLFNSFFKEHFFRWILASRPHVVLCRISPKDFSPGVKHLQEFLCINKRSHAAAGLGGNCIVWPRCYTSEQRLCQRVQFQCVLFSFWRPVRFHLVCSDTTKSRVWTHCVGMQLLSWVVARAAHTAVFKQVI